MENNLENRMQLITTVGILISVIKENNEEDIENVINVISGFSAYPDLILKYFNKSQTIISKLDDELR